MNKLIAFATVFIALYAISTRASAEEVYRCGSAYSQKPCPEAVVVEVQDSRTPAQKAQADAKTRHETAQVKELDKAHQKEEAQRRADNAKLAAAQARQAAAKPHASKASAPGVKSAAASASKSKKKTAKTKKQPEFFVANVPTDKPKAPTKTGK